MDADSLAYLDKAIESLAGAESEYANNRYNNCANRCYYAIFQAAIAALIAAGIRPAGARAQWEHEFVQARFAGVLIKQASCIKQIWRHYLLKLSAPVWLPTIGRQALAAQRQNVCCERPGPSCSPYRRSYHEQETSGIGRGILTRASDACSGRFA